jgi:asparagine synthase (glutamine-hydrolysing)
MCGIVAVLSRSPAIRQDFSAVLSEIRHRGPDDAGMALVDLACTGTAPEARAWLGHRRLSILDLSARGHQPMESPDGRFVVIYNGEIYNFIELRDQCRAAGARFSTESDTEVLLSAWQLWGPQCVTRFKGMFAFVIIDRVAGTATAVRDQFGIKPLYYAESGSHVVFCSEVLPMLRTGLIGSTLDAGIAYEYLRFGAPNSTERTLLAEVRSLPAAQSIVFDFRSGKLARPQQYWSLRRTACNLSFEEAAAECRARFIDNVRIHLRSDVPVGAALSGGIDSSSIVCVMRKLEPDLNLETFSYIASDSRHSEERWVDLVHQQVGGVCHKIRPAPADLAEDLELLVRRQGEPFASASVYAQFCVFRAARAAGVPVTLDGQGADELLGGYWPHVGTFATEQLHRRRFRDVLKVLTHAAPGIRGVALVASMLVQNLLPQNARHAARKVVGRELFPSYLSRSWFESQGVHWQALAENLIGRYRTLGDHLIANVGGGSLPNLLRYADRDAMAFAIESRVPFLTADFAEFLVSLPSEYLISPAGERKRVFREAMKGILPEAIRTRSDKIGFFADDGLWLRQNERHFADVWSEIARQPMFDAVELNRFVRGFHEGRHHKALLVWRLLVFGMWLRELQRATAGNSRTQAAA